MVPNEGRLGVFALPKYCQTDLVGREMSLRRRPFLEISFGWFKLQVYQPRIEVQQKKQLRLLWIV